MTTAAAPRGAVREAILNRLVWDADMDGLVTTTSSELGRDLGVSQSCVNYHYRALIADGVLTPVAKGHHGVVTYRLSEQAMS